MAASLWMGGLLGFPILLTGPLRAMPRFARAELLGRSVRRFSKVATIAVMVLVATGLYAALLHVPSLSALVSTPYGRVLSMKLALLVFLLALGAQNLRLRGRGPFGRLVSAELVLAIGIFVATGFLTSLPPADDVQQQNPPSPTGDTKQSTMV
jgi:putative copper export protein